MNKVGVAYVLWLAGLFGMCGLHRLYNGEKKIGLLWLGTFGLFGFGQLLDLILIPKMVEVHNARLNGQYEQPNLITSKIENLLHSSRLLVTSVPKSIEPTPPTIISLLTAAESRGGKLSVTQGVMATGLSFQQVELIFREMLKSGYVEIGNDPETGVVLYEFKEL